MRDKRLQMQMESQSQSCIERGLNVKTETYIIKRNVLSLFSYHIKIHAI